ncbi:MAG: murein L,D-transpeptidase [Hyphomicrobium sp.]
MFLSTKSGWRVSRWIGLVYLGLAVIYQPGAGGAEQPGGDLTPQLAVLSSGGKIAGRNIASAEFLTKLYAALGNRLAWSDERNVGALRTAVVRSWEEGLLPNDFHADALSKPTIDTLPVAERDILMSDALVRLLYQMYFGKVYPNALDPSWNFARPLLTNDPAELISKALAEGRVAQLIDDVRLKHPLYAAMKATLQAFTQYEVNGGWPSVPSGPTLKPGTEDPRVPQLRARLAVTGEYSGPRSDSQVFDPPLVEALKTFQQANGLDADGVGGPNTLAALNVTVHERVEQIRVNLERARWILRPLGEEMVAVNIAGQRLHLFLKGKNVWSTRVIVGKTYTKTPIFTEPMNQIVFNPTWTVPRSIVRNEIFPKAAANPGYLNANNYYLTDSKGGVVSPSSVNWSSFTGSSFPYSIVQKPGPHNALGQVKFLFPNKYSVYLHDTPSRQLFDRADRSMSHGCIRVEDPLHLAELILGDRLGWSREKIDGIVATGKLQSVVLKDKLPVMLLYWTVDPTFDGGARFYRDLYQRDGKLLEALNAPFKPVVPKSSPKPAAEAQAAAAPAKQEAGP